MSINKMWHIHTMKYSLAIRRNEVLIHATIWLDLENILLRERGQSYKITNSMVPFDESPKQGNV